MAKWVYGFGGGKAEGKADMKNLLGGKGANLAEMANLGLPVPPGFTITTEVCTYFYDNGESYPKELTGEVDIALAAVGKLTGKTFGDKTNPLLVSVRSGARASMPGMMDTVLNLGLNDTTVQALVRQTGNARFAWDSYRRFVQMFGDVVLGVDHDEFEHILAAAKRDRGARLDTDLDAGDLERITGLYKECVRARTGADFPDDPHQQLWTAIQAVFGSWFNDRAASYRRMNRIPHDDPQSRGTRDRSAGLPPFQGLGLHDRDVALHRNAAGMLPFGSDGGDLARRQGSLPLAKQRERDRCHDQAAQHAHHQP